MLLLDEPTNHLDAESVAWLENFLNQYSGTVVAITHDRYFLDNVAGWILELDRGEGIPWEGNYSSWLEQKEARLAHEQASENARQKSIQKELEWVRQSPKGRHAKSKARLARFEELNSVDYQKRNETNELFIPPGPRLGDKVLEVTNLTKGYEGRTLINDLSFTVPKGAIVGIIGANGAGKSTLFRMITGSEKPDSGTITLGETVVVADVGQFRDSMDNNKTVYEEISQGQDILQAAGCAPAEDVKPEVPGEGCGGIRDLPEPFPGAEAHQHQHGPQDPGFQETGHCRPLHAPKIDVA